MAEQQSSGGKSGKIHKWDADEVHSLVDEPVRRQIILSLAIAEMTTALELSAAAGLKRHTYLKHVSTLRDGGIIVQKENPKDRRKPLYSLAPAVIVRRTKDFITVDFDCCMLRFPRL